MRDEKTGLESEVYMGCGVYWYMLDRDSERERNGLIPVCIKIPIALMKRWWIRNEGCIFILFDFPLVISIFPEEENDREFLMIIYTCVLVYVLTNFFIPNFLKVCQHNTFGLILELWL